MSERLLDAIKARDAAAARAELTDNPGAARGTGPGGASLVCTAVYYGQREIAEAIAAARGGDDTLDIFEASALGRTGRVRALLDADGALVGSYAEDGFYPLGLATYFRNGDAARLLIERGADVNQAANNPNKVCALHAAVSSSQPDLVALLLEKGADVDARQAMDVTPLMGAAHNGREDIVDLLLARGADRALTSSDGKTAAAWAREAGHTELAARLT